MEWGTATVALILQLLGKAVAAKAIGWGSGKVMQKIFGGEDIGKETLQELADIFERQQHILNDLQEIFDAIRWDNAIAPARAAELSIREKYDRLRQIAALPTAHERKQDAQKLYGAISDENNGVLTDLFTLDAVILARIEAETTTAIYPLFYQNNVDYLRRTFTGTSIPQVYEQMTVYELALTMIQFMGLDLYVNAALSQGEHDSAVQMVSVMHERLSQQNKSWIDAIPESVVQMATITELNCTIRTDLTYWLGSHIVMYGEPPGTLFAGTVGFRDRHEHNTDEQWVLHRLDDGTYSLKVATNGYYVYEDGRELVDGAGALKMFDRNPVPWRLIPSKEKGRFNICRDDGRSCFSDPGGLYDLRAIGRVASSYRDAEDSRWQFLPL